MLNWALETIKLRHEVSNASCQLAFWTDASNDTFWCVCREIDNEGLAYICEDIALTHMKCKRDNLNMQFQSQVNTERSQETFNQLFVKTLPFNCMVKWTFKNQYIDVSVKVIWKEFRHGHLAVRSWSFARGPLGARLGYRWERFT